MAKPRSKVSIAPRISPELASELRTFIRDFAGAPLYLTLSSFAEGAFRRHLDALHAEVEGRASQRRNLAPLPNHRR